KISPPKAETLPFLPGGAVVYWTAIFHAMPRRRSPRRRKRGAHEQKFPPGLRRRRRPLLPVRAAEGGGELRGGGHLLSGLRPVPVGGQRRPGRERHRHQPDLHPPAGQILPPAV